MGHGIMAILAPYIYLEIMNFGNSKHGNIDKVKKNEEGIKHDAKISR